MTQNFGKWRSLLWPVHNFELKKLLPMFLMFFCISFNYTVLRDTKDTLIVTASGSGAETIPFLKGWGVLPMAVIFMLIYAKLSNKLNKQALFYTIITPFIIFFGLFAFVLYPARDFLHPTLFADKLQAILPAGFMGLIALFRNWTYSLFYILSELWGSVALSLLFWGFANDIMKISEAKRFYALLGLGANLALLVSGPTIIYISNIRKSLPPEVDAWGISLRYLMTLVMIAGIIILSLYYWINKNVLTDPRFFIEGQPISTKKKKLKLSLKESLLYLARSKYILLLVILVIAYGISINIVEVTWKSQLQTRYPHPNDYATFMGYYSTILGVISVLMMLFVGGNVVRKFGWRTAAQITPIVLLVTGTIFFSCIIFGKNLAGIITILGTSPLMLTVIIGMSQNIMTKSSKYSLFDPTKEMAYIPLDEESKAKGKAAIDVVGARLGKSGGAFLQQGLILGLGSITAMVPYVAIILFGIIAIWILSVNSLNRLFLERQQAKETTTEEIKEEIPSANKTTLQEETSTT